MLSSLTLFADISGVQGPRPFSWLVNTLGTCHRPSRIESVKFMMLTCAFRQAEDLLWSTLDALFAPYPERRWPQLKRFVIRHFSNSGDHAKGGKLEKVIRSMIPVLASADILQFTMSGQYFPFSVV